MMHLRPPARRRRFPLPILVLLGLAVCTLLAAFAYQLPFFQDRVAWRLSLLRAEVKYFFDPPEEAVFTPNAAVAAMVRATMASATPTVTATPTAGPTATPTRTPTPTITPTTIPASVQLKGVRHEYQKFNNCGPATLSMGLSFWGWQGDQRDTAAILKPVQDDKNVMPYEMADYVVEQSGLGAIVRVGGDVELLKRMIAAGFPVIVEKGFEPPGKKWMGHYGLITGYDDARGRFTVQDSYVMPDLPIPYDELEGYWQHFNYLYLVIYPLERKSEVLDLLGPHADETFNFQYAAQRASDEIYALSGRERLFAWFNRGTNLMRLQDYAGAAEAFDAYFQLYADMDPEIRPYRMLWYQTGPYFAYFYTGRYSDVINLATATLSDFIDKPVLEESYYWRALAKEAMGDIVGAIDDLQTSLEYHPGFAPSLTELERLGATP